MTKRELVFIREMFDSIAPQYDFLNRFLSLRQDVYWRREMVKAAGITKESVVLDAACGTCDVALEIKRRQGETTRVIATDFSPGMLTLGKEKIGDKKIHPVCGNALHLPFRGLAFDALFIAFGIRNIMDRAGALKAFHQALKPGGRVVVLELTTPKKGLLRELYLTYFKQILPGLGGFFSKNSGAYHYLPDSVLKFPEPEAFVKIMKKAGFTKIRWKRMTFGIVTLFVGTKDG